jgi:hypothetical protein
VIYVEGLTTMELLTYEILVDGDIKALTELLGRKVKAQGIRKGVAA